MSERDPTRSVDVPTLARWLVDLAPTELSHAADEAIAALVQRRDEFVGLARVGQAFGLSAFEQDLMALVGLPDEHEAFANVARAMNPRGEPWLCTPGVVAALRLDTDGRLHLRAAIESGLLIQRGILDVTPTVPLPEASLSLKPRLWTSLTGIDAWPRGIDPIRITPISAMENDAVVGAIAAAEGAPGLVIVTGGDGRPRTELAAYVTAALHQRSLQEICLDADSLDLPTQELLGVHSVALDRVPILLGHPKHAPLPSYPGPVIICTDRAAPLELDDRPVTFLDLGERRLTEATRMWSGLLPELNGECAELASLLRVDPVRAGRAVSDARSSQPDRSPTVGEVVEQVRRRTDRDLPASVRLVRPDKTWHHLVATPDNTRLLRSVSDRLRGQVQVLDDWGFGQRSQSGVKTLFAGPPGTGKTLSAEIIAAELGLDLLVVDLSALVSKWLGETEKNISEVFDAAARCQSVLFFDECESIFGRRTDGSDAQGRWANLETSHLLTRIDDFDGLCVLATNLRGNIDDAFIRRLDVIVDFDEPGPEERLELWRGHLPAAAPIADDIALRSIADTYSLNGGLIRNAALGAAFAAAASSNKIDQRSLLDAIEQEYRKAGRSFPGIPQNLLPIPAGGIPHGN